MKTDVYFLYVNMQQDDGLHDPPLLSNETGLINIHKSKRFRR